MYFLENNATYCCGFEQKLLPLRIDYKPETRNGKKK